MVRSFSAYRIQYTCPPAVVFDWRSLVGLQKIRSAMPAPKQPYFVLGPFIAEQIIRLVAELRFYLGGENYTSGRYKSTPIRCCSRWRSNSAR